MSSSREFARQQTPSTPHATSPLGSAAVGLAAAGHEGTKSHRPAIDREPSGSYTPDVATPAGFTPVYLRAGLEGDAEAVVVGARPGALLVLGDNGAHPGERLSLRLWPRPGAAPLSTSATVVTCGREPSGAQDALVPFSPWLELDLSAAGAEVSALLTKLLQAAGARPRVVVVDDDEAQLQLMHAVLERAGLAPLCIHQARGATHAIAHSDAQLVILDINVPGLDGRQLCRKLRQDVRTRGAAVLFWSALPTSELERAIGESGASGYLVKGGPLSALVAEIKRHLVMAGSPAEPR